jgi:hypothetical protein
MLVEEIIEQYNGDFIAKDCRALPPKGNSARKVYHDESLVLGNKHRSLSTVKKWVAKFITGHLSITSEHVDDIHSMILND